VSQIFGTASDDITISNLFIAGFNKAIYANGANRLFIDNIKGDNINGLHVTNSYDCSRISNVHFWPFVTAGNGSSLDLNLYRSGIGIDMDIGNDGTTVTSSFTYGYRVGFHIGSQNGIIFTSCYVDSLASWFGSSTPAVVTAALGTIGVLCDAAAGSPLWDSGSITAVAKGVVINTNIVSSRDIIMLRNTQFAGNGVNHVSQINNRLSCIGCSFQELLGYGYDDAAIRVGVGSTLTRCYSSVFNNNTPFAVAINDFEQVGNSFYGSSLGLPLWDEEKISTNSTNPTQTAKFSYNNNAAGNVLSYYKANGTPIVPSVPSSPSSAWTIFSNIYTGGGGYKGFSTQAALKVNGVTTPSLTNCDGRVIFSVTPTGSTTCVDKLFIEQNGSLLPVTDNNITLGASGARWSAVWAANGTIQTSDERAKTSIEDAPLGLDFINALRPVAYKFKVGSNKVIRQVYRDAEGNEVEPNAEGAIASEIITEEIAGERVHYGLIAQEVKAVLPAGVDFGGWILTDKNDPTSEQGLRYEEFISPLIKAIQELKEEVEILKSKIA
jgi:hypothetical protein